MIFSENYSQELQKGISENSMKIVKHMIVVQKVMDLFKNDEFQLEMISSLIESERCNFWSDKEKMMIHAIRTCLVRNHAFHMRIATV